MKEFLTDIYIELLKKLISIYLEKFFFFLTEEIISLVFIYTEYFFLHSELNRLTANMTKIYIYKNLFIFLVKTNL